jgi:hypothetical protein
MSPSSAPPAFLVVLQTSAQPPALTPGWLVFTGASLGRVAE